jgi:hypothetical protein
MSFARAKYSDYEFSYEIELMALSTHKPIEINSEPKYKRGFKVRLVGGMRVRSHPLFGSRRNIIAPSLTPHTHSCRSSHPRTPTHPLVRHRPGASPPSHTPPSGPPYLPIHYLLCRLLTALRA